MSDTLEKKEMEKAYNPADNEAKWYDFWNKKGYFTPKIEKDRDPWVCIMPPPNVTGALHQGHALFVAIEDLMIRHARMRGNAALWVPGTDHAGIATHLQVEKMLAEEGTSRQAVGRDEFLRRTWEWKEKYGGQITQQLR